MIIESSVAIVTARIVATTGIAALRQPDRGERRRRGTARAPAPPVNPVSQRRQRDAELRAGQVGRGDASAPRMTGPSIVSPRSWRASRSARSRLTSENSLATKRPVPMVSSRPTISRAIVVRRHGGAESIDGGSSIDPASLLRAAAFAAFLNSRTLPSDAGSTMSATDGTSPPRRTGRPPRATRRRRRRSACRAGRGRSAPSAIRTRAAPRAASGSRRRRALPCVQIAAASPPHCSATAAHMLWMRPAIEPGKRCTEGGCLHTSTNASGSCAAICAASRCPSRARSFAARRTRSPSAPAGRAASRSAARADRSTAARRPRHPR